jgi:hypothetical protein
MSEEEKTENSRGGEGTATKSLEIANNPVISDMVDTIGQAYGACHKSAQDFINAVSNLEVKCNNLKDKLSGNQLTLNGVKTDFKSYVDSKEIKLQIGFGYSQFNKYASLKNKNLNSLVCESDPSYIMCFDEKVAPTLDNIKLALGDRNPWDERPQAPKTTAYEIQQKRYESVQKKITDAGLKSKAETALDNLKTAEDKANLYQAYLETANSHITSAKKVISKAVASVPKKSAPSKKSDKAPAPEVDVKELSEQVSALPDLPKLASV